MVNSRIIAIAIGIAIIRNQGLHLPSLKWQVSMILPISRSENASSTFAMMSIVAAEAAASPIFCV